MIINEKDWEKASPDQQSWMVFNTIQSINASLEKLEKRSFLHKICAFGGGIVGGALAYVGIKAV